MSSEGGVDVRRGYWRDEMEKERGGWEGCTGYNLSHVADLKKTAYLSCNHGFTG